jgi:hypothetical protein
MTNMKEAPDAAKRRPGAEAEASVFKSNFQRLAIVVGFACGLVPGVAARAQDKAAAQPDGNVTSYEFEDEGVHGDMYRPGIEVLQVRKRDERSSLIRVRTQFIAELLKSAERL